jgi:putative RecB family exonuclease
MKKIKLSATRISAFLQCKHRYWLNYVERAPKVDNPAFRLGTACHVALEYAGNMWMTQNLTSFSTKQKKEILDYFNKCAVEEGIQEYDGYQEGKKLVSNRLNNFAIGNRIIGLEIAFGFPDTQEIKTASGVPLIGAIDKVIELDEDTILVVDYKTSMSVPDATKLRSDVQLSMYNLVIKQLYPEYKRVILCLDMLRKGEMVYTYRTETELEEFDEYLAEVYKAMQQFKKKDAKPSINILCGWCDYRNICKEYKAVCDESAYEFIQLNTMSNDQLITEWEHVRAVKKILEQREKELASVMIDKIKVFEEPVKIEGKEMVLRQSARTTYNPRKLSSLIPYEDFVGLANIAPSKLKKYLEKNVKLKAYLDDFSEVNYTAAFLASRKIKK